MENKPLVSILITTFNRKKTLEQTIKSAINQTYKNIEILICDNHSEDGTEELCKSFTKLDSRIKYFRHDKNLGMSENSNFAHKKSSGEYVVLVNDDDWIDNDYIEKSLLEFEKHPDYVIISPTTAIYNMSDKLIYNCPIAKLDNSSVSKRIEHFIIANRNRGFIIMGLLRNSIIKEMLQVDEFAVKDRYAEDWTHIVKFLVCGKGKMINSTHLRKREGGATFNLLTVKKLWSDTKNLTIENSMDSVAVNISKSLFEDKFYSKYLKEIQKVKLSKVIIKSMKKSSNFIYKPYKIRKILLKLTKILKIFSYTSY